MNWRRWLSAAEGLPAAAVAVVVVTALLTPLRAVLALPALMLLYVPVIIGTARFLGTRASAAAAALSVVALDLFFVTPYYHLRVASLPEWIALAVFLIVALVSGQQTAQLRQRERAGLRRQRELELLNRLSFRIASASTATSISQFAVAQVADVLGAERVALYLGFDAAPSSPCAAQAGDLRPSSGEAALVAWVLRSGNAISPGGAGQSEEAGERHAVAASSAIPGVEAQGAYLPLQSTQGGEGVLFARLVDGRFPSSGEWRFLEAVANILSAALERQRLEEQASHVKALQEADGLKSTLVSSVSHELKTPLAAATARITGLLEEGVQRDPRRVSEELAAVSEDLGRLNQSIGDLLDLSRLESDTWRPRMEDQDMRDVLGTVLSRLAPAQRARLNFDLAEDLPDVCMDFSQMARALANLVGNALVYSPEDTPITVGANVTGEDVRVWVEDDGPGVTDADKPHVFEKFYRGEASQAVPTGTGLGLTITSEIVKSHGGDVWVEDAAGGGARFVVALPTTEEPC